MKIKLQLWGVLLPPTDDALIDEPWLALGENSTPALFCIRKEAQEFNRKLRVQAEIPGGRVVRVKATFKIKGVKR